MFLLCFCLHVPIQLGKIAEVGKIYDCIPSKYGFLMLLDCWISHLKNTLFPLYFVEWYLSVRDHVKKPRPVCRQDNGSVCDPPIYTGFGPQNITVITSQESHYWNAFLIGFTKTNFLHPPNYGYWDVSYIVGKVWMRRLQRR